MTTENEYWSQQPQQAYQTQPAQSTRPAQTQPVQPAQQQPAQRPAYQAQAGAGASGGFAQQPVPPTVTSSYQAPPAAKKRGRGWIVAIVIIVCLFIFTGFCVKTCSDSVSSLSSVRSGSNTSGLTKNTIGVIEIAGTIQYDGTECSPEGLKELLDDAEQSSYVKAIVLRVNSGGGTATAGEEMAEYLRQFSKPVVVSSASINASAAYEISAQADYIYVAKSTEIGAIGTAMQLTDLSGLFEKLGINMEVITSADSKDSSYGYRALTDDERDYYQKMIDQINDLFIENVATGRKMEPDAVRKLATGLVFTGVDSVENGLADAIGTREDAIKKAAELAGITDYDTMDLYLANYDISSFTSLLGEGRVSADDLLDALTERRGSTSVL